MKNTLACLILMLLIASAIIIVAKTPSTYAYQDRDAIAVGSTAKHWTGTDGLGRDRSVRLAAALLIGIAGAASASALTTSIAAVFGLFAAFSPKLVARTLLFFSDACLSLPWIFMLMMVRSMLPLTASPAQSAMLTFLCLGAFGWPACARAIYHNSLDLRSSDWMVQEQASGLRTRHILRAHVLPHMIPLLLPQFLICIPTFIMAEANLGALGLGIAEPMPSWGSMLLELDNSAILATSRWVYLPILLLVITLTLLEILSEKVDRDA